MSHLADKVALVTGASSGIGAAIATELAGAGCAVVGAARSFPKVAPTIRPGQVSAVHLDVTRDGDVDALVDALPTIDVLVHAAGIGHFGAAESLDGATLKEMLEVHVVGAASCTRAALPALRRSRGQIVFIGSIATRVAIADNAGYAAAKHGQLGYARSLAVEEQSRGVRVMTVVLGATNTDAWLQRPAFDRSLMIDPAEVASILVATIGRSSAVVDEIVITPGAGVL